MLQSKDTMLKKHKDRLLQDVWDRQCQRHSKAGQSRFTVYRHKVLRAGGYNFHIGGTSQMPMLELTIARPRPPIRTLEIEERDGLWNTAYLQQYNMKYENF